jgi:putative spermidine/putrescine transport system substrate-binding protein
VPVRDLIPKEGATGWLDTWMISKKAKHPQCATPGTVHLQPEGAGPAGERDLGETPVNKLACAYMNRARKGSCAVPREQRRVVLRLDQVLEDAVADCGNGKKNCMDYSPWVKSAWNEVIS